MNEWANLANPASWSYNEILGIPKEHSPRTVPRTVTSSANVNVLDDVILVSGNTQVTLESAVEGDGRKHTFIKTDAGTTMVIACSSSQTIDGAASISVSTQYANIRVVSNGTNWNSERADIATLLGVLSVPQGGTGLTAGISGGIPYYPSISTMAASQLLTQFGVMIGGGAGASPSTLALGATSTTLHGNTGAAPQFLPVSTFLSSMATQASSNVLVSGGSISSVVINGASIGATTASTGSFTVVTVGTNLSTQTISTQSLFATTQVSTALALVNSNISSGTVSTASLSAGTQVSTGLLRSVTNVTSATVSTGFIGVGTNVSSATVSTASVFAPTQVSTALALVNTNVSSASVSTGSLSAGTQVSTNILFVVTNASSATVSTASVFAPTQVSTALALVNTNVSSATISTASLSAGTQVSTGLLRAVTNVTSATISTASLFATDVVSTAAISTNTLRATASVSSASVSTGISLVGTNTSTATVSTASVYAATQVSTASALVGVNVTSASVSTNTVYATDVIGATRVSTATVSSASIYLSGGSNLSTYTGESTNTWQPSITFDTPGNLVTGYSVRVGNYTKIGRLVAATFNLVVTTFTHSSASGVFRITGLPFATANETNLGARAGMVWQGITKAGYTDMALAGDINTTTMSITASGSGQTAATIVAGDMPSGGVISMKGTLIYPTTG